MKDFNGGIRANPKKVLTKEIIAYLENNHQSKTNYQMALHLKVSDFKIQCWLKELNITKKRVRSKDDRYNFSDSNGNFVWDKNCVTI